MAVGVFLAAAAFASVGTCGERLSRDDLGAAITKAEAAVADLDDTAFRDRFNELAGLVLPCMGDLVPADLAARYHQLMAIHLYGLGDEAGAALALGAAKRAADGEALPGDLLSGELATAWAQAEVTPRTRRAPEPRTGTLAFDGVNHRNRPFDAPTLVQLFDVSGQALATQYLGPRDPLPRYPAVPRRRNALIAVSVGAGALGASALTWAVATRAELYRSAGDPAFNGESLDALRGRANLLSVVGGVGLALGVGAGSAAVVVGPR